MKLKQPFIYLSIILGCYLFYTYVYDGTEYTKSNLDNKFYRVRSASDKQKKADMLAIINIKLNTIIDNLRNSSYDSPNINYLLSNWKNGVSIKEIGKMETDAAYVINKRYMSFCLPDNNEGLDQLNLMTYVAIHELAHIMSYETGHGPEFIKNFEFLLNYAKTLKYNDPVSNQIQPVYIQLDLLNTQNHYCGVKLVNSIK
jgi:hypothetical protein